MGALIFGEGVINDALSIVLFKTFLPLYINEKQNDLKISSSKTYINDNYHYDHSNIEITTPTTTNNNNDNNMHSVAMLVQSLLIQVIFSIIIGIFCGLLHARIMKKNVIIKKFAIYQTALVMLFGYLAYCIAEAVGISGILTVFIAAITLAHYSW
jgi:NhaP-type Na+/H+ or K+/H+ antiporter